MTLSPKGNQPKYYDGDYFLKVDSFGGEALSEFLISLFLESTSFKDFVPYLYIFPNISKSPSYKPRYSFIPMFQIVLDYLYTYDSKLVNKINQQYWNKPSEDRRMVLFQHWMDKKYLRFSIKDRVLELQNILRWYSKGQVSYEDSYKYFSAFVTLDTIFINTDRHFQNFGLMFDFDLNSYRTSLLFDQGFSLGVGENSLFLKRVYLHRYKQIKMQPFGTTLKSNSKAVEWYPYDFDVVKLVTILKNELPNWSVLDLSSQWTLMKRQLNLYYPTDTNGVDTLMYLNSNGL